MSNNCLTLGSLFDGSGGFLLGGLLSGIRPVWKSEIEPFPIAVTNKRFPDVKHYSDVSKLNGAEIEPVDIITFGSPCQDMSIAGKRAGLDGSRSNLFYEAIRIVKEMRCATDGKYPRFICWENVLGAFSSNGGEDFKAVLESVCSVKGDKTYIPRPKKWPNAGEIVADDYSVAWRVLDAQYWGVPQRRKRIFLVADFAADSAGRILFESEGLSGYSAESFRSWQRTANGAAACSGAAGSVCLNEQGGIRMDVSQDIVGTLRAEVHGHVPCVVDAAGFCTEHSAKSRSIGFEDEKSPTLRAGVVPAAIYENHSQDTRYTGPLEVAPTVSSTYGMGGNNQPFVVENTECFDVRFTSEGTRNARQNCYKTDTSRTIDTGGNAPDSNQGGVAVVFGICSKDSNAMKSDNPHSGFYKAETARTLDANGGNPSCNQGGMAVVEGCGCPVDTSQPKAEKHRPSRQARPGTRPSHKGDGYKESGIMYTLNATEQHAVAFSQDAYSKYSENTKSGALRAKGGMYGDGSETHVYSTSKNSYHTQVDENIANTLVASDFKDPPTVTAEPYYIIRRLTPTECARLQGFPDWWCDGLAIENPSEEEMKFWRSVFDTYARLNGTKPRSDNQIRKWLKAPHTDSAEYTMWGNGVALPCVTFVLSGIVYYSHLTD